MRKANYAAKCKEYFAVEPRVSELDIFLLVICCSIYSDLPLDAPW